MAHPGDNLSTAEWEAICQRCGKCCLHSLQDEDTGEIYHTNVICRYYDMQKAICTVYDKRCTVVPECLQLTKDNVDKLEFMPKSCAYRRLFDPAYIKKPTPSLYGRTVSDEFVADERLEDYIVEWEDL